MRTDLGKRVPVHTQIRTLQIQRGLGTHHQPLSECRPPGCEGHWEEVDNETLLITSCQGSLQMYQKGSLIQSIHSWVEDKQIDWNNRNISKYVWYLIHQSSVSIQWGIINWCIIIVIVGLNPQVLNERYWLATRPEENKIGPYCSPTWKPTSC